MEQPLWVQLAWAMGRFPMALLNACVPAFVPFFWVDKVLPPTLALTQCKLGLSVVSASFAWTVQNILAALCGPMWGAVLDSSNSRYFPSVFPLLATCNNCFHILTLKVRPIRSVSSPLVLCLVRSLLGSVQPTFKCNGRPNTQVCLLPCLVDSLWRLLSFGCVT